LAINYWCLIGSFRLYVHLHKDDPVHPAKVRYWSALSAVGIVGPIFLGKDVNSNSGRYLYSHQQGTGSNLNKMFLTQDGAKPQSINTFLDILTHWC
jgi:hypothetical protein